MDNLRVRILYMRYGEAYILHRLRRSGEPGYGNDKCDHHVETDRRRSDFSLGMVHRFRTSISTGRATDFISGS